jgi:hypothetical protein
MSAEDDKRQKKLFGKTLSELPSLKAFTEFYNQLPDIINHRPAHYFTREVSDKFGLILLPSKNYIRPIYSVTRPALDMSRKGVYISRYDFLNKEDYVDSDRWFIFLKADNGNTLYTYSATSEHLIESGQLIQEIDFLISQYLSNKRTK